MSEQTTKTITFVADHVIEIDSRTVAKVESYTSGVNYTTDGGHCYTVFEFQFTKLMRDFFLSAPTNSSQKATLTFNYNHADSLAQIGDVKVVLLATNLPSTRAAASLLTDIDAATVLETVALTGYGRNKTSVEIDAAAFITALNTTLNSVANVTTFIALALKKSALTEGFVEIGGRTLIYGEGENWVVATDTADPPHLEVEVAVDVANHTQHVMRYTTTDPTADQSTPSNSIGGYVSRNAVYDRYQIKEPISSSQTTIQLSSDITTPTSGLVQIGPEIMSYSSLDTTEDELGDVTRGISPAAFPSSNIPFGEYAHVLELGNLFDTAPNQSLVQYRCVAVINTSTVNAIATEVMIRQNPDSDVQLDVGIEIPAYDSKSGIHTGSTGTIITDSTTFLSDTEAYDGKYDGAAIIINEDSSKIGIIDHFDVTGGVATISIDGSSITLAHNDTYRIMSAPSQQVSNDTEKPTHETSYFQGFLGDGVSGRVQLADHGSTMHQYDLFYLWVKRTFTKNKMPSNDTGAVIMIQYRG